mmetsp:Transcript_8444/g.16310  ORF Transcript_8444/g.16310 Transcript_8444/m.16310 type:complete len:207 (-) Transcript_8444:32-652(-)
MNQRRWVVTVLRRGRGIRWFLSHRSPTRSNIRFHSKGGFVMVRLRIVFQQKRREWIKGALKVIQGTPTRRFLTYDTTGKVHIRCGGGSGFVVSIRAVVVGVVDFDFLVFATVCIVITTTQTFCFITTVMTGLVVCCVWMVWVANFDGARRCRPQQNRPAISHVCRVQHGIVCTIAVARTTTRRTNQRLVFQPTVVRLKSTSRHSLP